MLFPRCFQIVVGTEGGYQADPRDKGNWTGGACGAGECRGTKWGISAAAYPALDIAQLSVADAAAIYRRDYWEPLHCGQLPPSIALLVFGAGVNCGIRMAARWLQGAVGVRQDGAVGPVTVAAVAAAMRAPGEEAIGAEILAQRLVHTSRLDTWPTYGQGWARRLCRLPYEAMRLRSEPLDVV